MQAAALFVSLALALLTAGCGGQDLDLSAALEPTEKPAPGGGAGAGAGGDDFGFSLEDALPGNDDDPKKPAPEPQPNPGSHGSSGGQFSDDDLSAGLPGGRANKPSSGGQPTGPKTTENTEGSQGMLAGIISSVVVAIAGALSSFIAYQKKKLCFKASDQENVNMESQQGAHAEAPVQRTLLQKQ